MLFFNSIPSFLTLIRKICFEAVNNLANIKLETIFKTFKEIYIYYMKCGFDNTTIHADGELTPLQGMVYKHMPG